jgi:hypothetical protein
MYLQLNLCDQVYEFELTALCKIDCLYVKSACSLLDTVLL